MSEMVERVARAIAESFAVRGQLWEKWTPQAYAAIAAMREPSEAMQVAGATENVAIAYTGDYKGRCLTPSHVWRAMIDAALVE